MFVYLNCQVEDGSVSGICHKLASQEHVEVVTQAMARGAFVNPLNPEVFPGVCKMEAEVNNIHYSNNDIQIYILMRRCFYKHSHTFISGSKDVL